MAPQIGQHEHVARALVARVDDIGRRILPLLDPFECGLHAKRRVRRRHEVPALLTVHEYVERRLMKVHWRAAVLGPEEELQPAHSPCALLRPCG